MLLSSQPDQQSLHLFSAISFLCAYVLVFTNPVAAALTGWLAAMMTRQIGHFFFEPKGYDEVTTPHTSTKKKSRLGTTCNARSFNDDLGAFSARAFT